MKTYHCEDCLDTDEYIVGNGDDAHMVPCHHLKEAKIDSEVEQAIEDERHDR